MAKSVREAMTSNPRCVTPETSVAEVARVMRTEDVGSLPIVTDPDRVVGMVTDRDLVLRVLAEGLDPEATPVAQIATEDPVTVDAEADLDDALVLMARHQLRRIPVVSGPDRIVGIIAQADVALSTREKTAGEVVAEISRPAEGPRL